MHPSITAVHSFVADGPSSDASFANVVIDATWDDVLQRPTKERMKEEGNWLL
jgi:hypothetical protein